jgi:hypothetical protein
VSGIVQRQGILETAAREARVARAIRGAARAIVWRSP